VRGAKCQASRSEPSSVVPSRGDTAGCALCVCRCVHTCARVCHWQCSCGFFSPKTRSHPNSASPPKTRERGAFTEHMRNQGAARRSWRIQIPDSAMRPLNRLRHRHLNAAPERFIRHSRRAIARAPLALSTLRNPSPLHSPAGRAPTERARGAAQLRAQFCNHQSEW
jgi:hypothetical protein